MTVAAIDVRDLVGHPGASREASLDGTLEGLGGELARVPDDAPIHGALLLESVVEGILVSGRLEGTMHLRCARCLTEFDRPFAVEVHELFTMRPEPEPDEGYVLDPELGIDPDQMLRDAIGVELPFSPLCRPDCLGLCETCGGNRNLGECPGHDRVDPRFAALTDLLPALEAIERATDERHDTAASPVPSTGTTGTGTTGTGTTGTGTTGTEPMGTDHHGRN